jgi:hypothetical protein
MGGGRVLCPDFGLLRSPGALAEAEHVGAKGVLSTGSAFVGQELAVRVYLALEPLEERWNRSAMPGSASPKATGSRGMTAPG